MPCLFYPSVRKCFPTGCIRRYGILLRLDLTALHNGKELSSVQLLVMEEILSHRVQLVDMLGELALGFFIAAIDDVVDFLIDLGGDLLGIVALMTKAARSYRIW